MTTTWSEYIEQGYTCLIGDNERIIVRIVPERGGKIISLEDKRSGKDWIHHTDRPWEELRYGMSWGEGDRGGWDEMFPTIEACPCPDEPWTDKRYPDHGEVWSMPWNRDFDGDRLILTVEGVHVPYRLTKTIALVGNELKIDYRLDNTTPHVFSYLWAAHPLLAVSPGMKLDTEPSSGNIQISYSHLDRIGKQLDVTSFPIASTNNGAEVNLSVMEDGSTLAAEKYYFTDALQDGYASLADPVTGDRITFRFSTEENPYLAIWANYGGFDDYTFAIEPASGYMDSVDYAHRIGKVKQVQGYSTNHWTLSVALD